MTTPLITRLEEAAEGSRELDAEIATRFGWVHERRIPEFRSPKWWPPMEMETKEQTSAYAYARANPPPVTSSIDAALALAERLHPCWSWSVGQNVHHKYWLAYALALDDDRSSFQPTEGMAKTPALALCIAILKANHKDKP